MDEAIRCEHCGDVIGVYEPMVVVVDGRPVNGSRATIDVEPDGPPRFHGACYAHEHRGGDVLAR